MCSVASSCFPTSPLETHCTRLPFASFMFHCVVYVQVSRCVPCVPLPPVAYLLIRRFILAVSAASRCPPLPPVALRCLRLRSHDLPFSRAASRCLSLPPAVTRCLPASLVGARCRTLFRVASHCRLSYPKLWTSSCRCLDRLAGRNEALVDCHAPAATCRVRRATNQARSRAGEQARGQEGKQTATQAGRQ